MENNQNELGIKLEHIDLADIEFALDIAMIAVKRDVGKEDLYQHLDYLRKLFVQLREEGERGGYDEWIIQEILA